MNLRPYQQDCIDALTRGFEEGHGKLLVVIPTGGGKTVIFAKLAEVFAKAGGRTLVLAHREELIQQAVEKIHKATGIIADVDMADRKARLSAQVVVASVQTMIRRRAKYPADHFALVVVDEAHHIPADSYLNTLRCFDGHAKVVGVTATPDRGDKKNLGKYFDHVAFEIGLPDLVKAGFLSPIRVKTVPVQIDLSQVHKVAGDYDAADLGRAIEPALITLADAIVGEAWDRKIAIFLPLRKTSNTMATLLRERGIAAEHVDGESRDRAEILRRLNRGDTQVICNAMLLTEGWDEPSIDCVVNLRPTKVRALYSQIVGRGTRLYPGKDHLLLLDFLWQSEEHNLIKPCHLVAKSDEEARAITEALSPPGGPDEEQQEMDLLDVADDVEQQRLKKIKERLEANKGRKAGTYDAMEIMLALDEKWVAGWEPSSAWDELAPTPKQLQILGSAGFDASTITCRGYASALIDRIFIRRQHHLATTKQVMRLKKWGHPSPQTATFDEATAWIEKEIRNRNERFAA